MMNYTPGPWKAEIDEAPPKRAFYIKSREGRQVAMYLAYDDHTKFAHDKANPDEVEGNAKVLAAASELLDYVISCAGDRDDCVSSGMKKRARDLLVRIIKKPRHTGKERGMSSECDEFRRDQAARRQREHEMTPKERGRRACSGCGQLDEGLGYCRYCRFARNVTAELARRAGEGKCPVT